MVEFVGEKQLLKLNEMCQQGMNQAETVLAGMVSQPMQLHVEKVQQLTEQDVKTLVSKCYDTNVSMVSMAFDGEVSGELILLFPAETTTVLINTLTKSPMQHYEMDVFRIGTMTEVGNIMMNGVMAVLCSSLGVVLSFSLPTYDEVSAAMLKLHHDNSTMMIAKVNIQVADLTLPAIMLCKLEPSFVVQFNAMLAQGSFE